MEREEINNGVIVPAMPARVAPRAKLLGHWYISSPTQHIVSLDSLT